MRIDINHLSLLARLKISDNEKEQFETQMQDIINMVEHLPEINADDSLLDPSHPMTLRKDEPKEEYKRDEILRNAPQMQAGCVVVPKIIEE